MHVLHGYMGDPTLMHRALLNRLISYGHNDDSNVIGAHRLQGHHDPRKISIQTDITTLNALISNDTDSGSDQSHAILYTNSYSAIPALLAEKRAKAYIFDQPMIAPERIIELAGDIQFQNGLAQFNGETFSESFYEELKNVELDPSVIRDTPTLWISGTHDQLFPPELVDEAARKANGMYVELNKGHNQQFKDPFETVSAIEEFLLKYQLS